MSNLGKVLFGSIFQSSIFLRGSYLLLLSKTTEPFPTPIPPQKMFAKTPKPPYYAVIFSSLRTEIDEGYDETADEMVRLASLQPGYLGHESAREDLGITISYWQNLEAIKNWKANTDHLIAQRHGREKWYSAYKTRIALVERDYEFEI